MGSDAQGNSSHLYNAKVGPVRRGKTLSLTQLQWLREHVRPFAELEKISLRVQREKLQSKLSLMGKRGFREETN